MNKDYRMAKFVNLNNEWVSYNSQKELLKLYGDEIDRLKEKIEKAIKYLEQPYRDNFDYSKAQLLNILKGEENE